MSKRLNLVAIAVWAFSGGLWMAQSRFLGYSNLAIAFMYGYMLWPTLTKADETAKEIVIQTEQQ